MAAASVAPTATALEAASSGDPYWVTTPLDPDRVEALLRKYCIFDHWQHIVSGLRMGFDVRIKVPPLRTYTFQKPPLFMLRPCFH